MQLDETNHKRRAKAAELLRANVEASEQKLESWWERLNKNNHNPTVTAATGKDVPNALVCLDEARTLLDGGGITFVSVLQRRDPQQIRPN